MSPMTRASWGGFLSLLIVGLTACQASVQAGAQVGAGSGEAEEPAGEMTEEPVVTTATIGSLRCNHSHSRLAAGTYHGDLVVDGNHCLVEGAGVGQTIIDGALVLSGNHNAVRGLTVLQPSRLSGNHNKATGTEFRAGVTASGNHNTP